MLLRRVNVCNEYLNLIVVPILFFLLIILHKTLNNETSKHVIMKLPKHAFKNANSFKVKIIT